MADEGANARRSRSAAIDAVRVLGLTAVVAGHAFADPVVRSALYPWHVPVFFFLTGYLWTSGRDLGTEIRKRSATLLRPYLAWLLLGGLLVLVVRLLTGRGVDPGMVGAMLLGGTHIDSPLYTFWFVTALLFAALLYRLLERLPIWARLAVPGAALAVTYAVPHVVAGIPLSVGVAVPSVLFLLAGTVARRYRPRIRHPLGSGLAAVAVAALAVSTGASRPVDIKQGDFGTPVLSVAVAVLASFGIVLIAEVVIPRLGNRIGAVVVALAAGGLLVMLVHPVVLWALGNDADAGSWPLFLSALAAPWALAVALRHTALSPWVLGVPRATAPRDVRSGRSGSGS
ncbi:acyltransferase family protein [Planctomonas psychrotolerans]|uniref:acyltransferase family protein n=1 Tax=Planctomonas psychrotolerans TaxID=2528712 RepID=UPI00123B04C8|nr:acyltransferase family protein [Planctomonas psychrotolerans]